MSDGTTSSVIASESPTTTDPARLDEETVINGIQRLSIQDTPWGSSSSSINLVSQSLTPNNSQRRSYTITRGRKIFFHNLDEQQPTTAAGVLLFKYHEDLNKTLFLLGKEYENGWCHFGGKVELEDSSISETAVREFNEETYGTLSKKDIDRMKNNIDKGFCKRYYLKHSKQVIYLVCWNQCPSLDQFATNMEKPQSRFFKEISEFKWDDLQMEETEYRNFFGKFLKQHKHKIIEYAEKTAKKLYNKQKK
ncbi:hypothetical protein C9374_008301 [Naegleria lovaniensis]|uniref:Nudix hydrolase domain-containing protein n=1 Tax=Naegleria lovaniensis TaxID=51637 RepID=A0AA88GJS5_NAELO|nr:uncharacterized protein C9374_008301 [Naegleria lovaniensis]KAG2378662.1 hypothetical protein C9374_008301 [Naegleria lovaniensis]